MRRRAFRLGWRRRWSPVAGSLPQRTCSCARGMMPRADVGPIEPLLDAVAKWAASRPDILGIALIGSWARGTATGASDVDLIILAVQPEAFRDANWPNEIPWAVQTHAVGWHDVRYGAVWSRHVQLSNAREIEFSFAERSWAATDPVDRSTLAI